MDTEKQILTCLDTMIRRIETTRLTDPQVFAETDKYIKAALSLLNPGSSDSREHVLSMQLLALELMIVVPDLLVKVQNKLTSEE